MVGVGRLTTDLETLFGNRTITSLVFDLSKPRYQDLVPVKDISSVLK